MSFRKGLANVLRAVASEFDPEGGSGGNVNVRGCGMNFSAETEIPNRLRSEKILGGDDGSVRVKPADAAIGSGIKFEGGIEYRYEGAGKTNFGPIQASDFAR